MVVFYTRTRAISVPHPLNFSIELFISAYSSMHHAKYMRHIMQQLVIQAWYRILYNYFLSLILVYFAIMFKNDPISWVKKLFLYLS